MTTPTNQNAPFFEKKEVIYCICEYLGVRAILRLTSSCQFIYSVLLNSSTATKFWNLYLENNIKTNFQNSSRNMLIQSSFPEFFVRDNIPRSNKEQINDFLYVLGEIAKGSLQKLEKSITSASSLDREREYPGNALRVSRCFLGISSRQFGNRFFHQSMCGCAAGNRACYWSSAPFFPRDAASIPLEYLTVGLQSTSYCIVGFSVTPYQAYWHPRQPVYGPREDSSRLSCPIPIIQLLEELVTILLRRFPTETIQILNEFVTKKIF